MLLARISYVRFTNLAILCGKQNSADYVKVLANNILTFAKRKYGANYVFQQDNDPIHTSKLTLFPREKHKHFELASSFSCLNPIENAWAKLRRLVYKD